MCLSMQQYVEILYFSNTEGRYFPSFKQTVHPSNSKNKCWLLDSCHLTFCSNCPNLCLYIAYLKKSTKKASVEQTAFNFKTVGGHSLLKRRAIFKIHMKNLNR